MLPLTTIATVPVLLGIGLGVLLAYYYSSSEQTYHKKVTNFTPSPMGGSSSKSLKCKICNKEISANTIIKELSCGHKFHSKCWTTLEKQGHEVCPDCRRKDGQRMY
ncbi:UNVERIFIED_CONTAM: hypothetical protein PYX00_000936 [Menopon gallinae]|uniref:RING-type domain-containing protein n=1 Tax=Menopon gallinae TaxID=328185 RepID=A0AAW2IC64_9NEOP